MLKYCIDLSENTITVLTRVLQNDNKQITFDDRVRAMSEILPQYYDIHKKVYGR